jgi:hypothetical protein
LTITRAQRDAIYEIVIPHLTAIGDVWLCVKRREFAETKRMGREFAEELRLLEDLGWSETIDRDTVTLTVSPDELARTVARLHRCAARLLGVYVSRPKNDEEFAERDIAASETLWRDPRQARATGRRRGGRTMTSSKPTSERWWSTPWLLGAS